MKLEDSQEKVGKSQEKLGNLGETGRQSGESRESLLPMQMTSLIPNRKLYVLHSLWYFLFHLSREPPSLTQLGRMCSIT